MCVYSLSQATSSNSLRHRCVLNYLQNKSVFKTEGYFANFPYFVRIADYYVSVEKNEKYIDMRALCSVSNPFKSLFLKEDQGEDDSVMETIYLSLARNPSHKRDCSHLQLNVESERKKEGNLYKLKNLRDPESTTVSNILQSRAYI